MKTIYIESTNKIYSDKFFALCNKSINKDLISCVIYSFKKFFDWIDSLIILSYLIVFGLDRKILKDIMVRIIYDRSKKL